MCPEHSDDSASVPAPGAGDSRPSPPAQPDRTSQHRDHDSVDPQRTTPGAGTPRRPELDELLGAANEHLRNLASTLASLEDCAGHATPSDPHHAPDGGAGPARDESLGPELARLSDLFDRVRAQRRYHDLSYMVDQLKHWVMADLKQWVLDKSRQEAEILELRERIRSKDKIIHKLWQWHRDRGYTIPLNRTASRAKRRFRRWSSKNRTWIDKIGRSPDPARMRPCAMQLDVETVQQTLAEMELAMEELWSSVADLSKLTPRPESDHQAAEGLVAEEISGALPATFSSGSPDASTDARTEGLGNLSAARNSIAIYTAITGNRDVPKVPASPVPNCDFICFTESEVVCNRLWQLREFDYFNADPERTLSYVKLHPHLYLKDYEWSIWVDSNLLGHADLAPLVQQVQARGEGVSIATFRHPHRDCIYDEAEALVGRKDLDGRDTIQDQVERYRDQGYPAHAGLCETTVIVRRHNDPEVIDLMTAWWREIDNGSKLDQLSLNYVAHQRSVAVHYLEREGASVCDRPGFERFSLGRSSPPT